MWQGMPWEDGLLTASVKNFGVGCTEIFTKCCCSLKEEVMKFCVTLPQIFCHGYHVLYISKSNIQITLSPLLFNLKRWDWYHKEALGKFYQNESMWLPWQHFQITQTSYNKACCSLSRGLCSLRALLVLLVNNIFFYSLYQSSQSHISTLLEVYSAFKISTKLLLSNPAFTLQTAKQHQVTTGPLTVLETIAIVLLTLPQFDS